MDEVKEMKFKKLTDFKCKRAESSGFSDEIISDNLYRVFEEAKKVGVSIASYADPASSVNIVGPKFAEKMAIKFTYPLLKRVADLSDDNI